MTDEDQKQTGMPALGDRRGPVRAAARLWMRVCADPKRAVRGLIYACAFFAALDFLFLAPGFDKHAHHAWENGIGFYGVYGFVSCSLMFFIAKRFVRPAVKRDEDYYE